jgi:hypothetical protein
MKKRINLIIFAALGALALGSCSGAKKQLGLTRSAPDEFAVIKRAPLEMPKDYSSLPEPSPGASRPQETSTIRRAQQSVFGKALREENNISKAEEVLLGKTGAGEADPSIRQEIDREAAEVAESEKPVAQRILNWSTGLYEDVPARVVDPEKEAERLRRNMEEGQSVTAGETRSVTR